MRFNFDGVWVDESKVKLYLILVYDFTVEQAESYMSMLEDIKQKMVDEKEGQV